MPVADSVIVKLGAQIGEYRARLLEAQRLFGQTTDRIGSGSRAAQAQVSSSFGTIGKLMTAGLAVGGALAVGKAFLDVADKAKQLEASLRLATSEFGSFNQAQADVRRIAAETATGLNDVGKLYGTFMRSANELGITQSEAARATETIAKSFLVFGADATTAAQGTRQLVQAIQSGVLRGDEFNTMMEAAPGLARLLADSMGMPITALRALAEAGALTGDQMLKAFTEASPALALLDQRAADMPMTFDRAMTQISNAAQITFSAFDRGGEFSNMLVEFVTGGADEFGKLEGRAETAGMTLRATFEGLNNIFNPMGDNAMDVMSLIEREIRGLQNLIGDLLAMLDSARNAVGGFANDIRQNARNAGIGFMVGENTPPSMLATQYRRDTAASVQRSRNDKTKRFLGNLSYDTNFEDDPRGDYRPAPKKVKGGKRKKGVSAETAAKRAAAEAKRLENERLRALQEAFQYDQEIAQFGAEIAAARAAQLVAADAIYQASLTEVDTQTAISNAAIQNEVTQQRRTQAQADILIALNNELAAERKNLLHAQEAERLRAATTEVALASKQNEMDLLEVQSQHLNNREMQRDAALRMVELQFELERLQLEEVIASRTATKAQKDIAAARLRILDSLEAGARRDVEKAHRSPGEQYRDELATISANMNDEIEKIAVDKFKELGDAMGDAVPKALGLKGAIGELIASLAKLFIQQALLLPLMNALFPGGAGAGTPGNGGGIASIFSTFFGGRRASGGPVKKGKTYLVGERGQELFSPASNGNIIPNHQLAPAGGSSAPGMVTVQVVAGEMFAARVAEVSGPVAAKIIDLRTPRITDLAAVKTRQMMGRPKL